MSPQVAPTLTLCGVAKTYFRLCADSKPSSYQDRMELLVSQGISSAAEWQQLVGSCILFMARNGLQHATMHFLRQAAAYNSCGDISNLMHYAVVSLLPIPLTLSARCALWPSPGRY